MKMRSGEPGTSTSATEVVGITPDGVWLLLDQAERFLPFEQFPWLKDARVRDVLNVERPHPGHLYWPGIDVDLHVESITHPGKYPLVSRPGA